MAPSTETLDPRDSGAAQGVMIRHAPVIIRHAPWCLMWLGLLCVGLIIALAAQGLGFKISGGVLGAYAAQGLLAEWLGVTVTPNAVAMPGRLLPAADLPSSNVRTMAEFAVQFGDARMRPTVVSTNAS
jgi:hypothetical protein